MWPGEIGNEAFTDKKGINSVEQEHIMWFQQDQGKKKKKKPKHEDTPSAEGEFWTFVWYLCRLENNNMNAEMCVRCGGGGGGGRLPHCHCSFMAWPA